MSRATKTLDSSHLSTEGAAEAALRVASSDFGLLQPHLWLQGAAVRCFEGLGACGVKVTVGGLGASRLLLTLPILRRTDLYIGLMRLNTVLVTHGFRVGEFWVV